MTDAGERALLVGLSLGGRGRARTESSLEELALLARSAGARVVGTLLQERARRDSATLIGRGKVEEAKRRCEEEEADVVFFDEDLSPAQQRNLEQAVGRKTLDRTQLILDIFARRARTREGRLQVELAQLDYMLPRLAGKGVLLSRLGGGIGTRAPVRRSSRPTGGGSGNASRRSGARSSTCAGSGTPGARPGRGGTCRWSPSSATRTPASRLSSTP